MSNTRLAISILFWISCFFVGRFFATLYMNGMTSITVALVLGAVYSFAGAFLISLFFKSKVTE